MQQGYAAGGAANKTRAAGCIATCTSCLQGFLFLRHFPACQECNLGQNLAVLRGHQGPINLISFHPTLPLALLSSSSDGTVRLWDASDQHLAPQVLGPAQHAAAQADTAVAAAADGHTSAVELGGATARMRAVVGAVAAGAAHFSGRAADTHAGLHEGSPEVGLDVPGLELHVVSCFQHASSGCKISCISSE